MRWKERFLVPDHRVQDINGASFAGFYYVCVDFEPQPAAPPTFSRPVSQGMLPPLCAETGFIPPTYPGTASWSPAPSPPSSMQEEPAATMCGFYFHQNSEPYQQLSLTHVKDRFISSFEFR